MRAVIYEEFGGELYLRNVPDPIPPRDGVVVKVEANGVCRSDWHGWQGHDSDVKQLPHVPGHELAGIIVEVGADVKNWQVGARVTVPFSMGCGHCVECQTGNQQICDNYFQPGFLGWGSFAEYVALPYADVNLVAIPEALDFVTTASLGCRFITSFRAMVHQGRVQGGEWVAVYGCGGVGLSAIMIAQAMGANVIGVDVDDTKLALAQEMGASHIINARTVDDVPQAIQELTRGGVHISLDALGSVETCRNSILSLRKRGRHVQVGLLAGAESNPPLPMGAVISKELEILGSHGMQTHVYPQLLDMVLTGKLQTDKLVQQRVNLTQSIDVLKNMSEFKTVGITVIDEFAI